MERDLQEVFHTQILFTCRQTTFKKSPMDRRPVKALLLIDDPKELLWEEKLKNLICCQNTIKYSFKDRRVLTWLLLQIF